MSVAATAVAMAASTSAAAAERVDLKMQLTSPVPGSATGLDFHVVFRHPRDSDKKPPALTKAMLHAPDGTAFNSRALPRCRASDAELQTLGNAACPSASKLTLGSLMAMTGLPAPLDVVRGDNHVYNGPEQIIELITFHDTQLAAGFDRLRIDGSTLVANPPMTPGGPPDGRTTVRSISFRIPALAGAGGPYISAPPTCPKSGVWTSTGEFRFADGGSPTVTSTMACTDSRPLSHGSSEGEGRRRDVMVVYRHGASARWIRRHRSLGVTLRVDGRLRGVRGRLVQLRTDQTVAETRVGTLARDAQLRFKLRRGLAPGRYRVIVSGRTAGNRRLTASRRFRIRP